MVEASTNEACEKFVNRIVQVVEEEAGANE
jgi:hypothetical protein